MGLLSKKREQYEPMQTGSSAALRLEKYREKYRLAYELADALLQGGRQKTVTFQAPKGKSPSGGIQVINRTIGQDHHQSPSRGYDTLKVTVFGEALDPASPASTIELSPQDLDGLDAKKIENFEVLDAVLQAFTKVDPNAFQWDRVSLPELLRRKLRAAVSYWSGGDIRFK